MSDRVHLTTRLDRASKVRFGFIAKARGVSESALFRQLVESTLRATDTVDTSAPEPFLPVASSGRISVREWHGVRWDTPARARYPCSVLYPEIC
jgi:hypothetical protein